MAPPQRVYVRQGGQYKCRAICNFDSFSDLIHIITKAKDNPKVDVEPYRNQLFDGDGPTILWAMHFIIPACLKCAKRNASLPGNVQIACGPMFELDYDQSIKQACELCKQFYLVIFWV